jgi:plasmid stabilization system protein ParE
LTHRRVRFTSKAVDHVRRQKAWWLKNRDYPDVFGEEFERVLEILSRLPGIGTPYKLSPIPGVRRVYLRRAAVHVYYTFDSSEVIIRSPGARGRACALPRRYLVSRHGWGC